MAQFDVSIKAPTNEFTRYRTNSRVLFSRSSIPFKQFSRCGRLNTKEPTMKLRIFLPLCLMCGLMLVACSKQED